MTLRQRFKTLMRHFMRVGAPLAALLIALALPQAAHAQVLYGSIVGNVKDKSNDSVTGATVKITHKETNQTRETVTGSDGGYNFSTVQTGTYTITISKVGFKSITRSNVEVTLNNITRSDISLEVGDVSETVSVTAEG